MPAVPLDKLRERAVARLQEAGTSQGDAQTLVDHMLTADLVGKTSHGLSVRFTAILRQAEDGIGDRTHEVVLDRGHVLLVDGNNGFGYTAALACTHLLIERTREHAVASVGLRHTRHTGMLGYYVRHAAGSGIIAMAFGNCCPMVAPCGGSKPLLGTNPLAFGFPADPDPVVVDMATSAISYGDLMEKESAGESLPTGLALDSEGRPTCDPTQARSGALLPFGGHKGGALALAVQIISGVLMGGPAVPPPGSDYALLLVGISKDAFAPSGRYDEAVRTLVDAYLSVPGLPGQTLRLPGRSRCTRGGNHRDGVLEVSDELAHILHLDEPAE